MLHTGKTEDDVEVAGAVIGAGNLRHKSIFTDPGLRRQSKLRIVVLALSILGYGAMWYSTPGWYPLPPIAIAFLGAVFAWDLSNLRTKKIPRGLEAFERS